MRNALATPACPSTTATASADWLFGALRALEQQRGILFILAIDHNRVEVLAHHLLDGGKGFGAGNELRSRARREPV